MGVITVPFISDYLAHKHAQEQAAKNTMTSAQAGNSGQAVAIKGNGNQAYQNSGSGSITVNQYAETKSDTDLTGNRIFDLTSKADKNEKGETYVHGAVKVKWSPRPGEGILHRMPIR